MRRESPGSVLRHAGAEEHIERCIQFALRGASPGRQHDERRRQKRHPFPYPVRLTPVNANREVVGLPIVVIGKHLTNQGFDFYFHHPVSHRRVIARFDCESSACVEMLLDLAWCRFSGHGWYENGGRFLAAINPPSPNNTLSLVTNVASAVASIDEIHA